LPDRSATYWIAFEGTDDYGYGVCVDDVTVSVTDTPAPNELRAESVTQTNAVLHWSGGAAASWSVEWGASGFTPGEGTTISNLTSESYALEGLAPGAAYDFYVISHYAGGDSDWSGPASFSTLYASIDIFPWDEGFEGGDALPGGWSMEYVDGSEVWHVLTENEYLEPGVPHEGDWYSIFVGYDNVTRLVTRELDLSGLSAPQLSFWHLQRDFDGGQDQLRVYYRTSAEGTWTLLSGAALTEEVYDWTQRTYALPSPSSSYFIAFEGTGYGGWGVCLDDIRVEDSAYAMPSELSVDKLYSTSVGISWNGSGDSYDLEWGPQGFTIGSGTRVTGITGTAYEITELADKTAYDVYVRAVYADGASGWAGPESFDTFWGVVNAFPWIEDFETGYEVWDHWDFEFVINTRYWLMGDGGGGNDAGTFPTSAYSGEYNARFMPTTETGSVTRLISRALDLSGLTHPELSFFHAQHVNGSRQDELHLFYRVGEVGTWNLLPDAVFTNNTPDWQQRTLALPESADSVFIGFLGTYNGAYGVCLDDVQVYDAVCPIPTNLSVSAITGSSANFAWSGVADHWNIEWGATGFTPESGTHTNGIATPSHTLTGLNGWTTYDVYVQSVCGVSTSAWAGPVTFKTVAGKIQNFPWSEDFEAWQTIFERWQTEIVSGVEDWMPHVGGAWIMNAHFPVSAYSGEVNVLFAGEPGNVAYLITPELDLRELEFPRLRFRHAQKEVGDYQDELRVYYKLGTGGTWAPVPGGVFTTDTPNWTERMLYIPVSAESCYIGFKGTAGESYGVCVDDVVIDGGPCPPPLNLRAENVVHDAADLLWDGAGAALWNLEWGPQGFTPGEGTLVSGIETNFYTLTGLAENTTYDFYVQEDRSTKQSAWEGPASFTTPFAPVSGFPWLETFEHDGILPEGWENIGDIRHGQLWHFDVPGGAGSDPVQYAADADHTSGSGHVAWLNDSYPFLEQPTITLVSRELDLTGVDYPMLSFRYWIGYGSGSQWPSSLEVDVFDGTQWHNALRVVSQSMAWSECTLDLTPYKSATTRIRFCGLPRLESTQSDIALDDVGVLNWTDAPACTTPLFPADEALATPVADLLQWNAVLDSTGYKLWLGTDNPPSNLHNGTDLGDVTSFAYGRLDFDTTYFWKIVPYSSGGGDAAECPVWSFATETALALPWANDFETDSGGFTHGADNVDEWEWGAPDVDYGIQSGYGGSTWCWGTDLDYFAASDSRQWLKTGWFDLTDATDPELSFQHIAHASDDYAQCRCFVEISTDGHNWSSLPESAYLGEGSYYGSRLYFNVNSYSYWDNQFWMGRAPADDWWRREKFSLAAWTGQPVQLRFNMDNRTSSSHGWFLDDIRVDEKHWWIQATAGTNGTVAPSGAVLLYHGDSTNFVFTPSPYHHVADVTVNGSSVGAISEYLWSNASADGTIQMNFAPDLAAQGTPHAWLADYGWTSGFDAAESANPDNDPYTTAEEYVADTDPTNSASYLHITAISNGPPVTVSFEPASTARAYTLQVTTNLVTGPWADVPGQGPRPGTGGDDAMSDDAGGSARFYRLKVEAP
jgi:hypothetical protein